MSSNATMEGTITDGELLLSLDILIVDDEIANLKLLAQLLTQNGYKIRPAESPQLAIDSALSQPPTLILLDIKMPEMDGFEVSRRLKQDERTHHVPIIFISALDQVEDKVLGFEAGCVDFITKPFQEEEVLARVRTHMELRGMQLQLEEMVAERTSELAKSEAKYRGLVDNSMVGVFTTTIDGRFGYVNNAMVQMYDFDSPEHMIAHGPVALWSDPRDRERMLDELQKQGSVTNFEAETISHTERPIHVLFSARKIGNDIIGMVMDITDRKRAEEGLRRSKEFNQSVLMSLPDHIAVLDREGNILTVNDSWIKFAQKNDANFPDGVGPGLNYLTICRKAADKGDETAMEALHGIHTLLDGSSEYFEMEYPCDSPTEKRWFLMIVTPFRGKKGGVIVAHIDITRRKMAEIELRQAYDEIGQLKNQVEAESAYLQEEIKLEHNFENIIGHSEPLKYVLHRVEMVAPQDSAVMIMGETGTGKELIARAVHQLSSRSNRPLVKINCAALPEELIESELFGREKGAFTGATTTQVGRFELAQNSTIFLDEIGELPLSVQAKLLRVLESGNFERLGSPRTLHSDARIIAATNRDLEEEVRQKRFREDLWYRLNVFTVTLPPLRDRIDDIPILIKHFVHLYARKMGKKHNEILVSKSFIRYMQSHLWPGNVRELKHRIESAMISIVNGKLDIDLPSSSDTSPSKLKSFEDMERDYLLKVLQETNWKVGGMNSAADILKMPPSTLRSRMKKLGIQRP